MLVCFNHPHFNLFPDKRNYEMLTTPTESIVKKLWRKKKGEHIIETTLSFVMCIVMCQIYSIISQGRREARPGVENYKSSTME